MARKVDTRLVNRRLNLDGSGGDSYYRETPREKRTFSPLFVLALTFVFVGGAGATFFLTHSRTDLSSLVSFSSKEFVSVADAQCKTSGRTPDLDCYLSNQTKRLCDPAERRYLRKITDRYMAAWTQNSTRTLIGGIKAVAILKSPSTTNDVMAMSQAMNRTMSGRPVSASDKAAIDKHFNNLGRMQAAVSSSTDTPAGREWQKVSMSEGELIAKIRRLGRQGLLTEGDFGWFPNSTVKKAFADIGPVYSVCTTSS